MIILKLINATLSGFDYKCVECPIDSVWMVHGYITLDYNFGEWCISDTDNGLWHKPNAREMFNIRRKFSI